MCNSVAAVSAKILFDAFAKHLTATFIYITRPGYVDNVCLTSQANGLRRDKQCEIGNVGRFENNLELILAFQGFLKFDYFTLQKPEHLLERQVLKSLALVLVGTKLVLHRVYKRVKYIIMLTFIRWHQKLRFSYQATAWS